MTFIKRAAAGILFNIGAILVCQKVLEANFLFTGSSFQLISLAFALTLLNLLIKPLLHFFFTPLIWLTFGLFTFIINVIILKIAVYFVPQLAINSSLAWLGASLIISIFNSLLYWIK
ncbi:MAG: Membrane protein of unknown function [Parcubacteria group bacterium ADurb.Bin305]|jgi:putative membrane protein|nr:phage holin family protein [Candidatus Paceibacterota bacterium]OQA44462.1 MAG: Membrane protein of unknown function [Parcubacteria group bacterium ADurb.Bin305]